MMYAILKRTWVFSLSSLLFACGPMPGPQLTEVESGFNPTMHGFSFKNYAAGEDVPVVDTAIARRLFGDDVCQSLEGDECVLSPAAEAWTREVNGTTEGGHCEGFAVLSQLAWSGDVDLSPFGGSTASAVAESKEIKEEISYWYATQWSPKVHEATQLMTVNEIAIYLNEQLGQGESADNLRLGLLQVDGTEVTGAHAVQPLSIKSDEEVAEGETPTKWRIGVYDSNFPGGTRYIDIDTEEDSWSYQAAPGDEGLFEGGPGERNRIYVVPSSARTGAHPCYFCSGAGTEERHVVGYKGPLAVDVYDQDRNRAGESEDGLVSEILGVRVLPIFGNLALDRPTYIFDATENSCATIVARTRPAEEGQSEEISITSTKNGNTVTVGGEAGEGTHYVDLSPDGTENTYHTDTGNGGPLTSTVPSDDGTTVTVSVETPGNEGGGGELVLGVEVDPETHEVEVHFESDEPMDVRVTMEVEEEDGTKREGVFLFEDMEPGTLATDADEFTGMEAPFEYDQGDTGIVDEIVDQPTCASSTECPPFGSDLDNISDDSDNCPGAYNPEQRDLDGDGIGDACDTDKDGDNVDGNLDCNDYDEDVDDVCSCPAGSWDHDDDSATACEYCSAGEYCPGVRNAPVTCPAGTEDADDDPTTACAACSAGTWCEGAANDPVACAAGTSDHDQDPATDCEACAPGQFCEGADTAAVACPLGAIDDDADASTPCVDCGAGEYCAVGTTVAEACPAGTVDLDEDPATPCDECGLGHYCAGGVTPPVLCHDESADLDQDPATPCEPCPSGASYDGYTCADAPSDNCASTEFQCDNGDCIDAALTCDGTPDCPGGGGEDEDAALCMPACPDGYTGDNCEISIPDGCVGDPCQNGGTCTDTLDGYTCTCLAGFTGDDCETNIDDCDPNPCQNGGTCADGINDYTCTCPGGFTGDNCETVVDNCNPDPCQNGGTCVSEVDGYSCSCPAGYTGTDCETNVDDCDPNPCQNGGSCTDGVDDYTCSCPAGYTGADCETNIDDCDPNPCQNGGTCTDGVEDYTCACPMGYTGADCETEVVAAPYAWFCDEARYGDGQFCDCACGAVDPDCGDPPDGLATADTGCEAGVQCDLFSDGICAVPYGCANDDQCGSAYCGADFDCFYGATCDLATNRCTNWDFDPATAQCRGQELGGTGFGFSPPFMIGECAAPSSGATADGASCTTDEDCASGNCVNGACSPWCIDDADCGAGNTCVEVQTAPFADPATTPGGSLDVPQLAYQRFCVGGSLSTSCDTQGCATGECRLYFSIVSEPQHFCSDGTIDNGAGGDVGEACTPNSCQAGLLCYQGACRLPCPPGTPCAGTCTSVTVHDWLTEDTADDNVVDLCLP